MQPNEFVTSDTHFGHASIIGYCNRPFANVEEMEEGLIARWNAKVPADALVYHLGDFAFAKPEVVKRILDRLHGRICLIRGNHEQSVLKLASLDRFDWVKDYHECRTPDKIKVVMCHYPFVVWNESHHGAWGLHGHSHGTLFDEGNRRFDVGVDTHWDYEPYSYAEIKAEMDKRTFKSFDHHGDKSKPNHRSRADVKPTAST